MGNERSVIYDLDRGHERSEISCNREAFTGLLQKMSPPLRRRLPVYIPERKSIGTSLSIKMVFVIIAKHDAATNLVYVLLQ